MIQLAKPLSLVLFVVIAGGLANDAAAQRIRLEARLDAVGSEVLSSGKARYEARRNRAKFTCEVEDLVTTKAIVVFVNGDLLGAAPVNELGTADLNLPARLSGRVVPPMFEGDIVEVFSDTGELILEGVLEGRK